jgi:hypothetical protein
MEIETDFNIEIIHSLMFPKFVSPLEKLPHDLKRFIESTGANILGYREAMHQGTFEFGFGLAQGMYNPIKDAIYIADHLEGQSLIETVLHELIHWTGHKGRLDRLEGYGFFNPALVHTEEGVAELGMVALASQFNLPDPSYYVSSFLNYVDKYKFCVDDVLVERVEKAVAYLNELITLRQEYERRLDSCGSVQNKPTPTMINTLRNLLGIQNTKSKKMARSGPAEPKTVESYYPAAHGVKRVVRIAMDTLFLSLELMAEKLRLRYIAWCMRNIAANYRLRKWLITRTGTG